MSETTLNGCAVAVCSVLLPRIGVWTADVDVDAAEVPAGPATLVLAGRLTLSGTVTRGGSEAERWRGRIVGGAGGLERVVPAVAQQGGTFGLSLADVAARAGEQLSVGMDDLSGTTPIWHRIAAPAAHAVADVARAAGCAWRVLPDGTVWMGQETWPLVSPAVDVIDWRPDLGRLELAGDVLGILPGQTLRARSDLTVRVGCVEHRATGDALRTVVLVEPDARERGRLVDAVARVVAALTRRLDYQSLYPATVVAQDGDGTLHLTPDDPRVPGCRGVPIRHGLPGVRVKVPTGARVLLTYEGGDPRAPVATLWDAPSVAELTVNGGTHPAARRGHATENGGVSVLVVDMPTTPPTTDLHITYAPPSGAPQVVTISGLPAGVTASGSHSLTGVISEGTDVLHLP